MATVAAKDVPTSDDELYDELYDVRREAEHAGNLIDVDPYPGIDRLREKGPLQKGFLRDLLGLPSFQRHRAAMGREGYTCLSFDLCDRAFRDHVAFSNSVYHIGPSDEKSLGILEMDNPEHFSYRRAVQSLFIKPRAQKWWRVQWINEITRELMEMLAGQDAVELNKQLCARVPVHTITRAVGMEGTDALIFRRALVRSMGTRNSAEVQREALATVERMLLDRIAKLRAEPGEDIISWLIANEIELAGGVKRPLTDREIVVFARLLLLAGGGTTWRQFGIVLLALLSDQGLLDAVRSDRRLVDVAIQESLRWNPTNPVFSRFVVQDIELGGITLPKGAALEMCVGAANRDPARWDQPNEFLLRTPPQRHLGTGAGPHMCLGRDVAASEIDAGLNALLDRFPKLRLDPRAPAPYMTGGLEQRGVSALHVLLK